MQTKTKAKPRNQSNHLRDAVKAPAAKKPSKNDDDDDAEEVYNEWETHSCPETKLCSRKKESKKRELDDDQAKKPSPKNAKVKTEAKEKKKKKWIPRATGARPTKAIHQADAKTREKLEALQKPMEVLQAMTLPFYRSDEHKPPALFPTRERVCPTLFSILLFSTSATLFVHKDVL